MRGAGLEIVRVGVPAKPVALRAAGERWTIPRIARERDCAVVLHESFPVPRARGIPLVLTVHDLRALEPSSAGASWARRRIAPAVVRRGLAAADRIIAVSEFTRREIARAYPPAERKTSVVPNAGDHLRAPAPALPRSADLVLAVGHLEARKGCDLLLEAFALLHRERPASRLRLAGSGGAASALRVRARALGVEGAVAIAPAPDDGALARLYAEAAIVAVPSRYEGSGIPVLEAMALGAPVVAANGSALPETAGGAALLVDEAEPRAWAGALGALLRDGALRSSLADRGRARAAELGWAASARALARVLSEAALGAPSPPRRPARG